MIKLLQKNVILPALFCFQGIAMLNAQSTEQTINGNLTNDPRVREFSMEAVKGTPSLIKMKTVGQTLSLSDTPTFLQTVLGLGQSTTFVHKSTTSAAGGLQVDVFQQYNNGIKVEHGVFKAISQKNIVQAFTAEFYNLASISATPSLSESAALQKAFDFVGATSYAWDYVATLGDSPEHVAAYNALYPKGELVMVDDYETEAIDISLAYKFNVYAAEPLSRADIYVDASSGKILLKDAIIKHIDANSKDEIAKTIKPATKKVNTAYKANRAAPLNLDAIGDTRYAGRRVFNTSLNANGFYELKGTSPTGITNETFSYEGIGGAPISAPISGLAVSIFDGDGDILLGTAEVADNKWDAVEHRKDSFEGVGNVYPTKNEKNNDDVALDAHWGAEIVLRYWSEIHNRSSFDNKGTGIINYVHYGDAYDNAFWNGTAMTYGDGSYQGGTNPKAGSFAPLTSMDVCGHEIGHGVCEFTADLVYAKESGAMNEGFSDIWAASVENYVLTQIDNSLPYIPWAIGEQIDERDGGKKPGEVGSRALRWMDSPKAAGDPDCYDGANWVPVSGVDCATPNTANDQCGVHSNSGVLNKWYYLMVAGSGQAISGGLNKELIEDQLTDAGSTYEVLSIGFDAADQITYLAETMLTPNATFQNMRDASILAAQTLYGIASFEEQQVTNAWFGVDIGAVYSAGLPDTIVFSDANLQIFTESNEFDGCLDVNSYDVVLVGVGVTDAITMNISLAGSTATEVTDYVISTKTLVFPVGNSVQTITIDVKDDAIKEESETIVLSYMYKGVKIEQVYTIGDDDFVPKTGAAAITLLDEKFDVTGTPVGWEIFNYSEDPLANVWKFNGSGTAAGRAFITDGIANTATYNSNAPSNTILVSPLLNAGGTTGVTVSFDWQAGGEIESPAGPAIFDYGEFVYSTDGSNFTAMEKFHGTGVVGTTTASGTYSAPLGDVDGLAFFVGWRWFNDTNAGSQFSFAIDNVVVTATPAGIETQAFVRNTEESVRTSSVNVGDVVNFLSKQDDGLMVTIKNASADLGCVSVKVVEEGSNKTNFTKMQTNRAEKVYYIETENPVATYDLTVYYTDLELGQFSTASALKIIKVKGDFINDADFDLKNYDYTGTAAAPDVAGKFRAYTGTFKGPGLVTVSEAPAKKTLSTDFPSITDVKEGIKVYPNPVVSSLTIEIADSTIKSVAIYNILGKTMKVMNMEAANKQAIITVSDFAKGLYVLKISTADGQVLTESFFKE
jgi:Zn-dependent metalloprotease